MTFLLCGCCVHLSDVQNKWDDHEEALSLQPMFPPKSSDIFSPEGGCSEGLDAFRFFLDSMDVTYNKSMDQPGKVANPARGQLNRENEYFLPPFAHENLVSRDSFGNPVPRQPAHLHTQAETTGVYLRRDSSRFPRRRRLIYLNRHTYPIGSVPSLSGHAVAYRWRSLLRVRRHGASKPQGSSE